LICTEVVRIEVPGPGRAEPTSAVKDGHDNAGGPLALGGAGEHVHIAEGGGPGPHIAGL
jgi:hypothetical protein